MKKQSFFFSSYLIDFFYDEYSFSKKDHTFIHSGNKIRNAFEIIYRILMHLYASNVSLK